MVHGPEPRSLLRAEAASSGIEAARPLGGLAGMAGLVPYLRCAPLVNPATPLDFLWLNDRHTGTDTTSKGHETLLAVHVETRKPDGRCSVDVELADPAERCHLNRRELQVLTLIACGLSNPEISLRLEVARRTVATHIERLLAKLDLPTRAAAAAVALDRGLITLPIPGGTTEGLAPVGAVVLEQEVRRLAGPDRPGRALPRPGAGRRLRRLVVGGIYAANQEWTEDGRQMLQGAQLAIAELNLRGGVAGRLLEHRPTFADITSPASVKGSPRFQCNK
ncbi:hypothetical protein BV908_21320 [Diaphorobacter sp. LR2014-1]|nr:hypothetical protein BV908_21320 [Diaphorobacter sp. LR2014-1]